MERNIASKARQKLVQKVSEIGPWFHSIDVGENILTREVAPLPGPQPDDHPRKRWVDLSDEIPMDLSGRRILDIGCADGFFTLEFARRNAKEVVAVDSWVKHINRIKWLKDHFDLANITPIKDTAEHMTPDKYGEFDIVFMLGLLYHLKDPLTGLESVSNLTNVLYLESISIFDDENSYLYLKPPQEGVSYISKWIPTTRCIRDMLNMVGFDNIAEITPPYHLRPKGPYKNRPIYVARKIGCRSAGNDG